ncbi:hypothetical protein [Devosia salina]|uniref:Uncharacterized protein n=1 Tax=Devosia salina TaxID=2860336 RepID=A0ABX8WAQ7_9HYPH|nr:hypothetical protein [Devosia salina]QYO76049.1 hypothetical protein K1X15_15700 [Devosia salina]
MHKIAAALFAGLLVSTVLPAMAEDWVAARLHGNVEKFANGSWSPLARGDSVPDASKIRTEGGGRVELQRGEETISLGGNTEIVIHQAETRRMSYSPKMGR